MTNRGAIPARAAAGPLLSRDMIATAVVAFSFFLICTAYFASGASADLRALWLAGRAIAEGHPELVYPPDGSYFTMQPPQEWLTRLTAEGYSGEVFPYLYPPLWAWLMSLITGWVPFEAMQAVASVLNPVLLIALVLTAFRLAAPGLADAQYLAAGMTFLLLSSIGSMALYQNQPQILVAFLTVLAIERSERGHEVAGGALLALAAGLKILPAVFVLLLLAAGRRRAVWSFFVTGGALGLLSVAVVGWPLHQRFLQLLGVISDTAMLSPMIYSWESVIAQTLFPDHQHLIIARPVSPVEKILYGWTVLQKPFAFSLACKLEQLGALLALAFRFRATRSTGDRALLWPAAFGVMSLLGPIAWCYHYLAMAAFTPCLIDRLGLRRGMALLTVAVILTSPRLAAWLAAGQFFEFDPSRLRQALGTLTMTGLTLAFFLAPPRPGPNVTPPTDVPA